MVSSPSVRDGPPVFDVAFLAAGALAATTAAAALAGILGGGIPRVAVAQWLPGLGYGLLTALLATAFYYGVDNLAVWLAAMVVGLVTVALALGALQVVQGTVEPAAPALGQLRRLERGLGALAGAWLVFEGGWHLVDRLRGGGRTDGLDGGARGDGSHDR